MPPSRYKYKEYLLAKRVCSVSKSSNLWNMGRMYDISQPLVSSWRIKNDCVIRNSAVKPSSVVASVYSEHAQGLRRRSLHRVFCPSTMLSDVMSFAGGAAAGRALSLAMSVLGAAVVEVLGWRRVVAERWNGTCPSSLLLFASFQCGGPAAVPSVRAFTTSPSSEDCAARISGAETVWSRPDLRPDGGDWRI